MRVLVVDDDHAYRFTMETVLEDEGFVVVGTDSIAGLRAAIDGGFDAVLLDDRLGDGLGRDVIPEIRARAPATKILLMSGVAEALRHVPADVVLMKGTKLVEIVAILRGERRT